MWWSVRYHPRQFPVWRMPERMILDPAREVRSFLPPSNFTGEDDPPPYNTPYGVVLVFVRFGTLSAAAPVEPACASVRVEFPFVPLATTSWSDQLSVAEADPFQYVPERLNKGLDCAVPDVDAVVFAQVQLTGEVWLNVVAKVDMERVRLAAGLTSELQAKLLLPLHEPHTGSEPLETRHWPLPPAARRAFAEEW